MVNPARFGTETERSAVTALTPRGAAALGPGRMTHSTAEASTSVVLRFGMYSSPTWVPSYEKMLKNLTPWRPPVFVVTVKVWLAALLVCR